MKISKIKKFIEIILIINILVLAGMLTYDYYDMKKTKDYTGNIVIQLDEIIKNNKESIEDNEVVEQAEQIEQQLPKETVQINGNNVYGKIAIEKIGIEYPIIEYVNADALWKSICKISNNNIDGTGNLCLAGHNMRNLSMFGNLKKVTYGDIIKITDLYGRVYVYEVYEKKYIDPNQIEVLEDTDESIVTLITCNNSSDKRLIVKGMLI